MTTEEFSNEFDTLLLSQNSGLLFDEYEKSVFLTRALEKLIITLYNGKNPALDSFEKTEEIRRYLNELVKSKVLTAEESSTVVGVDSNSKFYKLDSDVWFITYEFITLSGEDNSCLTDKNIIVQPITLDLYYRISLNPFRLSNTRKALRLDVSDGTDNLVEIISKYDIKTYTIRYLSKPSPIILIDLEDNLSIDGSTNTEKTECKLNPAIHRRILEEAVRMAITSRAGNKK